MATLQLVSGRYLIQIFARLSKILRDYVFPLSLQADGLIVLNLGFQALFRLDRLHGFIAPRPLYTGPLCPTLE
jgi:hypothetical protein